MNASKLRVALLLAATFAAGTTVGIAADRMGLVPTDARAEIAHEEPSEDGEERRDRRRRETTIERFADDLELTDEQRGEIERILERYRASAGTMWREYQPRYRSLIDSVRTQIEALLSEDQVTQYRSLLDERYERRRDSSDVLERESRQERDSSR